MSSAERREKEKQERRESILNSAEQSFFGKGYERTSMDDIAKGAAPCSMSISRTRPPSCAASCCAPATHC